MVAGTIEYILKLRNELSKELGAAAKDLRKVGDDFTEVGKMASVGFTLPIVGAGAAALKFATDMNASMANVASLMPGSTERVKELKTEVQAMAIATGKSTGDLADGLYQVVSAFGDTADTAAILNTNARAAAAGVASTTDAINLTSAVTKGYGDTSAAAVAKVADLALQTVKLGQTTFPELAASIGRVTPLTAELGVKQEELFGVMATFTGVTGGAAEVSTQLRGVLQSLMSPTESMADLFEKVGVKSGKALIEQRGLQGAMKLIVDTAKSGGGDLKDYLGSIEGQTLALSAAGAQSKALAEKTAAMGNVAGVTAAAFAEQTAGINAGGFAWEQLKQKMAVAAQNAGDVLIPILIRVFTTLSPVIDGLLHAVAAFGSLPGPVQVAGVAFLGLLAAIGPLLVVLGTLTSSVATLVTSGVFMAVAGGIGTVGTAALAAAPALAAFVVASASVVAIGSAVRNAVGLYNDRLDQNRLAAGFATSHQLALAEASRVAGRAVTDVAEANNILRKHSADLRAEQAAGAKVAEAALQQTRVQAPAVKTLADALSNAKKEMASLTPYQRENIAAGLKLGMSVEDVAKAVKASDVAVGLYKERLAAATAATTKLNNEKKQQQDKFLASVKYFNSADTGLGRYVQSASNAGREVLQLSRGLELNGEVLTRATGEWIEYGAALDDSGDRIRAVVAAELELNAAAKTAAYDGLASFFTSMGQIAGSNGIGSVLGSVGNMIVGFKSANDQSQLIGKNNNILGGQFGSLSTAFNKNATGAQKFAAGVQAAGAIAQGAMNIWHATADATTRSGAALAGAMSGAQAGAVFGPWGAAAGAAAGVVVSLFQDKVKKAVQAANVEIDKVKDGLLKTYGPMDDLQRKAELVGLSFKENWGHQGPEGLKAMQLMAKQLEERLAAVGAASGKAAAGFGAVVKEMTSPWIALGKEIDVAFAKTDKADAALKAALSSKGDSQKSIDELNKLQQAFFDASDAEQALYRQQWDMAEVAKQQLADLGTQGIATFAAVYLATGSYGEALAAVAPSLSTLRDSYKVLGLNVEDVALQHLMLQSTVATAHPALMAAVDGQAGAMQGLAQMGLLNVDTFAAMQRTGLELYNRLQSAVGGAAAESGVLGDVTRDALMPMQGFLQQATTQAGLLGIPLDANTQRLIDQSRELGIWKDKGKSANDVLIEGMSALVGKVGELLSTLLGVSGAINGLPTQKDVTINTHLVEYRETVDRGTRREGGEDSGEGFAAGTIGMTGSWFRDFGAGRKVNLHGEEAVVRKDQAAAFAAAHGGGGGDSAMLGRIERLLRNQPRATALAVQNAIALGGRS